MAYPSTEVTTALIHLYRGELARMTAYRIRLDTTTNSAVVTTAGMVSYALGTPAAPHFVEQDGAGPGADAVSGEQDAQGAAGSSATEASSGDSIATQEQSGEATATQERQRACLSEVQSCCEAASAPDADPLQLRQGGNACELQACAE